MTRFRGHSYKVDPIVLSTNAPYSYAGNNPIGFSDPSGLCRVVSELGEDIGDDEDCDPSVGDYLEAGAMIGLALAAVIVGPELLMAAAVDAAVAAPVAIETVVGGSEVAAGSALPLARYRPPRQRVYAPSLEEAWPVPKIYLRGSPREKPSLSQQV